jgi:hypothetical protein
MPRSRRAFRGEPRRRLLVALLGVALAAATNASAHVVMGTKSLHLRVAESPVILLGRVVEPAAMFVTADGKTRRSLVEVEVLEELKGASGNEVLRIAQDGHAVATYREGDQALFFLKPIERSRELRSLAVPGGPTHVSSQEHYEEFVTRGTTGATLLSAIRLYVASETAETTAQRVALIRTATLDLLTSSDPRLADAALASLVLSPRAEWITHDDLPRLQKTLANPAYPIGFRAALIGELERRGLIEGDPERLALLRSAPPEALPSAIRAVGIRSGPTVKAFLLELVGSDSSAPQEVVAEAAIALGASRDPRALDALASALARPEPRVRNAAIRGLGLYDSPAAEQILSQTAADHPDPETRRRASAEAQKSSSRRAGTR